MSSGFNTDVHVGDQVFHVQTEDRGPSHPVIDTAVYQHGRILHRLASSYREFAQSPDFSADGLGERVEEQHRKVIGDLRAGAFAAEIAAAMELAARQRDGGVQLTAPEAGGGGGGGPGVSRVAAGGGPRSPAPGGRPGGSRN